MTGARNVWVKKMMWEVTKGTFCTCVVKVIGARIVWIKTWNEMIK